MALASVYYDVLNHISIDSSINSTNASERECAASHLRQALPGDLSILDRGFNAFWLYALYSANQLPFCMRAKVNLNLFCKVFVESGEQDRIVHLEPDKTSVEQGKIRGLPSQALTLRLVRVDLGDESRSYVYIIDESRNELNCTFKAAYLRVTYRDIGKGREQDAVAL